MNLKKEWENWEGFRKSNEIALDEIEILSLKEITGGVPSFYRIPTGKLTYPLEFKSGYKKGLPTWALSYIDKTGLAFMIGGKFHVAGMELIASISDLFGFSRSAIEKSMARDIHFAECFRNEGFAFPVITERDGIPILGAFLKSDGDKKSMYDFLERFQEKHPEAKLIDVQPKSDSFQCTFELETVKDGWQEVLVARDSTLGRESMTFFPAWKKDDVYIYSDAVRRRHKGNIKVNDALHEVEQKIEKSRDEFVPISDPNKILNGTKRNLGKNRTIRLKNILATADDVLLQAAAFADTMSDAVLQNYRLDLGLCCR